MSAAQLIADGAGNIRLCGVLSFTTVPGLLENVKSLTDDTPSLQVDLREISHTDSAGLALFIEWIRLAKTRNQTLRFVHMPEQMRSLARVSNLDTLLPDA